MPLTPDCPECGTKTFLEKDSEGGGFIFSVYVCACGVRWEWKAEANRRLSPVAAASYTPPPRQITSGSSEGQKVISEVISAPGGSNGGFGGSGLEVKSRSSGFDLQGYPSGSAQKHLTRTRVGRGPSLGYSAEFERVWAGCEERRGHKKPAYDAWLKVKLPAEVICPIYAKWRETDQWQRGFVPHLATWLNRRGWETEPGPGEFKAPDDGRGAPVAPIDVRRESFRQQAALAASVARVRASVGRRGQPAPAGAAAGDLVRQLADSKGIA